jgi:predicted nucleic acid-binding protein
MRAIEDCPELSIPVVVLGEYFYGTRRSRYRARYERWLEANLPLFIVLSAGQETARRYAEVRAELQQAGRPIPSNDVWIAALAREYRLPVLSRDAHFQFVTGLRLVGW